MPTEEKKKKVYIAGPMRGIPEFNFPAFNAVAAMLRRDGFEVFNPAEKDAERYGTAFAEGNATGDEGEAASNFGFSLREALAADLEYICLHADIVALLPGWDKSRGATAEYCTARALGLEIIQLTKVEKEKGVIIHV